MTKCLGSYCPNYPHEKFKCCKECDKKTNCSDICKHLDSEWCSYGKETHVVKCNNCETEMKMAAYADGQLSNNSEIYDVSNGTKAWESKYIGKIYYCHKCGNLQVDTR